MPRTCAGTGARRPMLHTLINSLVLFKPTASAKQIFGIVMRQNAINIYFYKQELAGRILHDGFRNG